MKKYPKYKDSGDDWIGEIPVDWDKKKMTYCFRRIGSGTTPISGRPEYYEDGKNNFLQTGDLNDGDIIETSKKVTDLALSDFSSLKFYPINSIVIAMYGATIGKMGILKVETTTNQACCVLSENNDVNEKFVFYWFISVRDHIISLSYGGGQPNINQDIIRNLRLQIPPITEQRQIVDFLNQKTTIIDDLIQKKKRKIELLKEHRTSIINQTVTKGLNPDVKMKDSGVEWIGEIPEEWLCVLIRHYYTKIGSGVTPRGGSEVYVDDGVTFIRSQNVLFEGLKLEDVVKISPETHIHMSGSQVHKGDLLLNITGASIGRCCVVNEDGEMNVNQHVCIIRTRDSLTTVFLNYFIQSNTGQNQLEFFITGSNREGLTGDNIKNFRVPLPPLPEQYQIVEFLDQKTHEIDTTITLENKKIDLLKEYCQSLISEVVTGKIDVRKN